jgi:hypothetical protein
VSNWPRYWGSKWHFLNKLMKSAFAFEIKKCASYNIASFSKEEEEE